jgi:hypothetical protein
MGKTTLEICYFDVIKQKIPENFHLTMNFFVFSGSGNKRTSIFTTPERLLSMKNNYMMIMTTVKKQSVWPSSMWSESVCTRCSNQCF